jgi:hypothetical protein
LDKNLNKIKYISITGILRKRYDDGMAHAGLQKMD